MLIKERQEDYRLRYSFNGQSRIAPPRVQEKSHSMSTPRRVQIAAIMSTFLAFCPARSMSS
jgi:hypothetical protein